MMFPLVELRGFKPLTSCMPCKSSNRLARAAVAPTCDLVHWCVRECVPIRR